MITAVSDEKSLHTGDDYYSGRILSACRAYGTGYSFCRFFDNGSGSGLLYNSSAVFSGEWKDADELEQFIMINAPFMIECPRDISDIISPAGYERIHRRMYRMKAGETAVSAEEPAPLGRMYDIVSEAFGESERDLWYADMSHRVRHGESRTFLYRNASCAAVDLVHCGRAYIAQVATLASERGKGCAGELLGYIAGILEKENTEAFLWAYDELEGFYGKLGYDPVDEDTILIRRQ